jgi:hypothetical protein
VLAPVLAAGFVWDDRADVLANPAASPAGFAGALGATNRPLLKATYALQRAATGADPLPFHAVNLALHLGVTAAVFALVRRVLAASGNARADFAAWVAAALWALHPAAAEAVAPVVGRSVLLSSALLLAAVLAATRERAPSPRAMLAAGALAFAAPLARETALVVPALLLLWQLTLGADEPRAVALRRQLPALAGSGLAAVAIALSARHRELLAFSFAERAPLDALRANVGAIFEILGLWVAPGRISIDPAQGADLPWSAASTLARAALLAAVLVFALVARRRAPAAAFAAGWTLLALAPSNSFVWRLDPVAPRALYLASIGPVLLVALAAARAAAVLARARPARLAAAAAALATLGCALPLAALARSAHLRAALWSDPAALWAEATAKNPESARPWQNLGVELLLADRLEPAEDAFRRALALDPGETGALCALDSIHIRRRTLADRERSH